MLVTLLSTFAEGWRAVVAVVPWPCLAVMAMLMVVVRVLWRQHSVQRKRAEWERERRLEIEAYSRLEMKLPLDMEPRKLAERAKRVCRMIAEKSCYPKSALYLRSVAGDLNCAGSCGMDDLTLAALNVWSARIVLEEGTETGRDSERRGQDAVKSFSAVLGARDEFDVMPGRGFYAATIVPLRMLRGRLVGAIAVCSDSVVALDAEQVAQAIIPIEVLAARLAGFVERSLLVQRLIEVERLAVAGQLVAGVARELTEPLTAVLGMAEMMAETATEGRGQKETAHILSHAMKMQEILDGLRGFWRPRESAEVSTGIDTDLGGPLR
jgi:hypothetical protein